MASLEENLQVLEETKANFKTALESKGIDLTDVPFTQYPEKLNDVGGSENLDTELSEQEELLNDLEADVNALEDKPKSDVQYMIDQTNSCSYLFYEFKGTELDFVKNLDTSNVTSMYRMFNRCTSLTSLDLSNFNTENVTTMYEMFKECTLLTSLDVSNFNTSGVTNMSYMFYNCKYLTDIIGTIDMIKATNVSVMFSYCQKLENVTLKNIKKSLTLGNGTTWGTKLSNATLINTIQQLWDLTGSSSQTLTLSTDSKTNIANIYVKLIDVTEEMLAQDPYAANKKPCVVCEPTDEGAMTITEYAISKNWAIA